MQSRADLVGAALLDGVALSATGLEEVGTLLDIACRERERLACVVARARSRGLSRLLF